MSLSDQTIKELISEAIADEVGLWLILRKVKEELHDGDRRKIKEATLEAIVQLLQTGKVFAGWYKSDRSGVERWEVDPPAAVERISREWDQLGREPDIGEIAVFVGA